MFRQDKRGLSEIIGYVILIVLALGMAGTVYTFLKIYVPKEKAQCPQDVSLIIDGVYCDADLHQLGINLTNRGLFTLQGAYIKVGKEGETFKTTLNCPDPKDTANCIIHFGPTAEESADLTPGEFWSKVFTNAELTLGLKSIEIQPVMVMNRTLAICDGAIVTQKVNCASGLQ